MKKIISLLLVLIMVIGLVACGEKTPDPTDPPKQNEQNDPAVEQTEAPTMADPSTVKFTVAIETALEDASVMPMFQMIGLHCMGCAMARSETVEQACFVHGVDPDWFVTELKAFLMIED